jgi:enoyl-CoA hydratase
VTSSTPADQRIAIEDRGPIRILTIHNERNRNAVTADMHREFLRAWREIPLEDSVQAVIVTGAGDAFSAGGDIDGMVAALTSEQDRRRSIDEARLIIKSIVDCPVPTIAAINGPAVGAGATFALFCDLAVIADTAYISDPHVNVGLVAGDGGAIIWPVLLGLSRSKQFLFTGDPVSAARAVDWGMAVSQHARADVLAEAVKLAERLIAQPSYALRATKAALNIPLQHAIATGLEASLASELASLTSEDFVANVNEIVETRETRRSERAALEDEA